MLSGLDGLERADPVLHLFPVLSTEDEPTERSDHLEAKGGRRYERVRQILWLNSERAQAKQSLMFPALSSSACGTSEWRTTGSVFKREQGCKAPLPLSLSPSLSLSLTYIHSLCLSLTLAHSHLLQLSLFPALHEALRQICADRQRASVKAKSLSLSRCLLLSRPLLVSMCVCVCSCV